MAQQKDGSFYNFLDSISGTENAVEQNKRIKEGQIAEDSREPTEAEVKAIDREIEQERVPGILRLRSL